jgi:hypothetical protein
LGYRYPDRDPEGFRDGVWYPDPWVLHGGGVRVVLTQGAVPKPSILDAVFSVLNLYRLWDPCLQAG